VAKAMQQGRTAEIVDELMATLKFDKHVFRPPQAPDGDVAEFESEEVSGG
jgi:hypothetical protein